MVYICPLGRTWDVGQFMCYLTQLQGRRSYGSANTKNILPTYRLLCRLAEHDVEEERGTKKLL